MHFGSPQNPVPKRAGLGSCSGKVNNSTRLSVERFSFEPESPPIHGFYFEAPTHGKPARIGQSTCARPFCGKVSATETAVLPRASVLVFCSWWKVQLSNRRNNNPTSDGGDAAERVTGPLLGASCGGSVSIRGNPCGKRFVGGGSCRLLTLFLC